MAERRNVLKAIGGSVSLTGVSALVGANGPGTVEIPVLADPSGIREWETVPKSWAEHRLRVRAVNDEVRDRFLNHPAVEKIGITGSDKSIDGKNALEVEVEIWENEEPISIPDEIDGVNISTTKAKESKKTDLCYNSGEIFYDVPGGVWADTVNGEGTFCCKVNDHSGSSVQSRLLTAAHVPASDQCSDDPTGTKFYMSDRDTKEVAEVIDYNAKKDWAVADITNNEFSYTNQIKLESNTYIEVQGWVTQDGLESYVGNETVKKMGVATGLTSGTLKKFR